MAESRILRALYEVAAKIALSPNKSKELTKQNCCFPYNIGKNENAISDGCRTVVPYLDGSKGGTR